MALRSPLRVGLRRCPPHQLPGLYAGGDCVDERVHKPVDQVVDRQCGNAGVEDAGLLAVLDQRGEAGTQRVSSLSDAVGFAQA